ncbi:MAG: hypothetical protein ACR2OU_10605 [Thermomicrobiales bacterium]
MINQVPRRGRVDSGRSQLATELLLTAYALVSSVIILRTLLVALGITDRVWLGGFVYGLTDPITKVLDAIPGATRELILGLTLADLTFLAPVLLFPLGLFAIGARRQ